MTATGQHGEVPTRVDVAVIGFGFSGLCLVAHLLRDAPELEIAVIGDDLAGHGIAYATRDPGHLLNVEAQRMGLWADDPGHFVEWLRGCGGRAGAEALGVELPTARCFAPRALYAAYLTAVHRAALATAGKRLHLLHGRVRSLSRGSDGWRLGGDVEVTADTCVLATGHDRPGVFGDFRHPRLYRDLWESGDALDGPSEEPIVLIGSGLTAIDAVVSLRRRRPTAPIIALSRNGRLPATHTRGGVAHALSAAQAEQLTSVSAVVRFVRRGQGAGDWREAVDALRPHTSQVWQRLDVSAQRTAVRRWAGLWSVHRHRMAPSIGARISREVSDGGLRVLAVAGLMPRARGDRLTLSAELRESGERRELRPAAIIDCTGPQLHCGESSQPLLRELVATGEVAAHPTGWGLRADSDHRVAPGLFALGPLLAGQLWESVAVPELREQAARIARAVARERPGRLVVGPGSRLWRDGR